MQNKQNLTESIKIRKIKAHVYLSGYCDNKKSYNIQRQTLDVNVLILRRFVIYINIYILKNINIKNKFSKCMTCIRNIFQIIKK